MGLGAKSRRPPAKGGEVRWLLMSDRLLSQGEPNGRIVINWTIHNPPHGPLILSQLRVVLLLLLRA